MSIEKEFVPYTESLELKELGFDEPCLCFYNHNSQLIRYMNPDKDWNSLYSQTIKNSKITLPDTYSAPTFSLAFRFFREKYKLGAIVSQFGYGIENEYGQIIHDIEDGVNPSCYEEAELACLRKLIEIVKNKS